MVGDSPPTGPRPTRSRRACGKCFGCWFPARLFLASLAWKPTITSMADRRHSDRDRRRDARIPAVFAVREATASRVQLGQAEDIGPGGMTIRHPKGVVLPPESPVLLSFELPDSREAIDAEGVVVSDRRIGSFRRTGVRFLVLRPEHQQAIAAFCHRAPKKVLAQASAPAASQATGRAAPSSKSAAAGSAGSPQAVTPTPMLVPFTST